MTDIYSILVELGYTPQRDNKGWRCSRIYCDGDNPSSLLVYEDGNWTDFVDNRYGNLGDLVKITLKLSSNDAQNWLKNKNFFSGFRREEKPKIKMQKTFDKNLLNNILPIYDYVVGRGISNETCKMFVCGTVGNVKGKLKNRFVWPIFNKKRDIIGFVGRSLDDKLPKYKIFGEKNKFIFPAYLNLKDLCASKSVVLVESPMDVMTLFECGIRNVLCLFGVEMSLAILNFLLRLNPKKIVISTNNDVLNGGSAGNEAAQKLERRLLKYFDYHIIKLNLPQKTKDWNECLVKYGKTQVLEELCGQ